MFPSLWNWLTRKSAVRKTKINARLRQHRRARPELEWLESRVMPATSLTAVAHPDYVLMSTAKHLSSPGGPTGYTPTQIETAYGINQISFNGTAGTGAGETIAIVDAYNDPNVASDLHQFDTQFGLPNPTLSVVNETGGSTLPAGNTGWAEEIALDVEWAHAIAPQANILLVEASSASYSDLFTAVQYAAKQSGVVAVSMSWGGSEFSGETSYDSDFTTPSGHAGVTFVASSGDSGAPPSYPSVSPNVLSVGGTTLDLSSSGTITSEVGWSDSGGGISAYESQPSYQKGVVTQTSTARANPDMAYDADPNTGFPVYNSYSFPSAPWEQFGGTSDAAPQTAALVAIADQGRALAGLGSLDGPSQTLPTLYTNESTAFHDITSGTSTGSPEYSAGPGYDLVTGLGSPIANVLVADLVGAGGGSSGSGGSGGGGATATHFSVSAPSTDVAGTSFSVTVTALTASGSVATNYAGTVTFTSSDAQAVLPGSFMFTSSNAGVETFTVTLKTAGNDSVSVADSSGDKGSATVGVSPAAASKLAFVQQPSTAAPGAAINPAVTVEVLDQYGNLESGDTTDQVTVAIGNNPGSATLGGTLTETVSGGIATFSNLTISAAGTGYTLTAASGSLTGATSASFNVQTATTRLIEGFESSDTWYLAGNSRETAYTSTVAAHDGNYGLVLSGNDWVYRTDSAAQVKAGDTLSVWVQFYDTTSGARAYFGFGTSSSGTLSLVAAPNTGQLMLMSDPGFNTYTTLAAVNASYVANHWYRLEVDWGTSGAMVGKLFDSNGTTLLATVSAGATGITSGGIALRAIGYYTFFDTITDTPGVNNFAVQPTKPSTPALPTNPPAPPSAWSSYFAALARKAHTPGHLPWSEDGFED